jgi:hypothetical protein
MSVTGTGTYTGTDTANTRTCEDAAASRGGACEDAPASTRGRYRRRAIASFIACHCNVFYFLLRWLALIIIFGFVDEDLVQCMNEVHTQKLKAHGGQQRKARPEDKLGTRHVTSEPKKQREAAGFAARLSAQHDAK